MLVAICACVLSLLSCGLPAIVARGLSASAEDALVPVNVAASTDGAQRTIMQCLGTQTLTRACHFENVYYDLNSTRFLHFGVQGATAEVFGDDQRPQEAWLRLIRGYRHWRRGQSEDGDQFHLDFRPGEALPAAEEVVTVTRPLHLRAPYNTKSIGHLIRDNLQFLVDLPLRFGRDPADFDWVRWHTDTAWASWETETPTAEHYRGLLNNRPSLTWSAALERALEGADRSRVKYVRFAELIAGQGPADIASQVGSLDFKVTTVKVAAWAHMCDPFPFTEMRHVAYRNYGLQVAAVRDLEPFVLFLDGQEKERRHLVNADALLPKLKQRFPGTPRLFAITCGVRMENVQISKHPLEEQLALLSKATVLVSNIGSRSFRLIYLPNGATTILVGPPEYEFVIEPVAPDGEPANPWHQTVDVPTPYRIAKPFIEIDWCWGYVGYVNMLRYHVESEAEVVRTVPWTSWTDARNVDIALDEEKISSLIGIALHRTEATRAQHGVGTLSAYNA